MCHCSKTAINASSFFLSNYTAMMAGLFMMISGEE
jgi:hypothetical protein